MPRRNYQRTVRKRINRELELLARQLEALARELHALQPKTKRRKNRKH
jgi:hypothetical protein